jgi:hypothetical protein
MKKDGGIDIARPDVPASRPLAVTVEAYRLLLLTSLPRWLN